jgi:glutathione synthase/RimK-type ligase-like ATP-grasp enzyme
MSLYGLDFVIDTDDRPMLIELNGICSGMRGFRRVYSDDRVEEKVYSMLRERYGDIAVNRGYLAEKEFKEQYPVISRFVSRNKVCQWVNRLLPRARPWLYESSKGFFEWIHEPINGAFESPFETYTGQNSTVFNVANEPLSQPTINPYVAEELTRNKFLQYRVLEKTVVREHIPPFALVGLGWSAPDELALLQQNASRFVHKPILGAQGRGVQIIDATRLHSYSATRGVVDDTRLSGISCPQHQHIADEIGPGLVFAGGLYLEELVSAGDRHFEAGMCVVQPFINSCGSKNTLGTQQYSSIRSIVCNGVFIDAYVRTSTEPVVNFSRGANAHKCSNPFIGSLSEAIVKEFEHVSSRYSPSTFSDLLYGEYFLPRQRDPDTRPIFIGRVTRKKCPYTGTRIVKPMFPVVA